MGMKDIHQFTNDVLKKVNSCKKKKKIKKLTLTCVISFLLVFLTVYSNLLPLPKFDMLKSVYESYKGIYASEEENTFFSFANNSSAILSINSVPYKLEPINNTKKEFNFNATKIANNNSAIDIATSTYSTQETFDEINQNEEYAETTEIKVVFREGGATIIGNFLGNTISIDVEIIKNSTMEQGIWKCFDKNNPNSSSIESYIIVNDNGETFYVSDRSNCYELMYISVYGNEYTILLDNYGMPSEFITVERLKQEEYGFNAIKLVSHIGNVDRYFKLLNKENTLNFNGGEFNAKYVKAKKSVEYLGKFDMAKYLPIRWSLLVEEEHQNKLIDTFANINLHSDGTVELKITEKSNEKNYKGNWFATDIYLIVVLEAPSIFGKTFVINNSDGGKSLSERAKSNVTMIDSFKTGYHDFDYYICKMYYTIYWGSDFTEDKVNNVLSYEEEYVLNGYYFKWYYDRSLPFNYDTEILPQSGNIKIIIHKNYTIDVIYGNRTVKSNCVIKGTEITPSTKILIKINEVKTINVGYLYLINGELRVQTTTYSGKYGKIPNHYIAFTKS